MFFYVATHPKYVKKYVLAKLGIGIQTQENFLITKISEHNRIQIDIWSHEQ